MATYIALLPVQDDALPSHCIHGRTTCVACGQWCWLGDKSHDLVVSGEALPVCMPCMELSRKASPFGVVPTSNAEDHLASDGPH